MLNMYHKTIVGLCPHLSSLFPSQIRINAIPMRRAYDYTVSLSPVYLTLSPCHCSDGNSVIVTSDHRHTFNVPSSVIAEYSPTLMVNVPDNSRTVACPRSDGIVGPICKTLKHSFLRV